ncbi:NACHT domain [Popillia japonica]|uniref:NACHT domain n=1 Tax=Popillia japonica TaxID=7064 RepID=A0AAW1LUB2_POPJA
MDRLQQSSMWLKEECILNFQGKRPNVLIVDCTQDYDSIQDDLWATIDNFREKDRTILIMKDIPEVIHTKYAISVIKKCYSWNELKIDSQKLILGKSIDFQGCNITLKEFISSDKHIIDCFPLEILIQKEKIKIGKALSTTYGYDESYYIARTFNSQIVIKEAIITDELTGLFRDRLAYTEKEFRLICEQYTRSNVHWLTKEPTGQLIWQRSRSSDGFGELYKYIDKHNQRLFLPENIDEFVERARQQKVIIIADTAGMGKTTVLTHVSKLTKEKLPKYWILMLNLSIYTEEFEKQIVKQSEVIEFLIHDLLKFTSSLEKILFRQLFCAGRVILMLDGFDEICPRYKTVITDFLVKLSHSPLEQLWVSTRPHLKVSLEYHLNQLSYGLEPFSVETQVAFLVKFWKKTLKLPVLCEESRMEHYATVLLEKLSRSINDATIIFTGIPLQTRMLAEAFTQEFSDFYFSKSLTTPKLPETLDLLVVYERFLQNKYRIYVAEKNKPPNVNVATKDLVSILKGGMNLRKIHQQLALEVLFPERKEILVRTKKNQSLSQEQLSRIGIVQYVEANRVHFIHRTFAEYYAADFFTNQFINQSSASVHVQQFLLKDVLLQPDSQIIRNFFNGLLTKAECSLSQSVLAQYATQIDGLWRTDSLRYENSNTILYVAVEEKNTAIVKLLLSSLKTGEYTETLRSLLLDHKNFNRINYNRRTAIYQASSDGCLDMLNILWLWAKEAKFNAAAHFVRFFLTKDESSATLWHNTVKRGHVNVFVQLYQWASEVFNSNYLKDLLTGTDMLNKTVWHYAVSSSNIEMFRKLQYVAQEAQLEHEHLKKIFSSTDEHRQSMWHYVASKKGDLKMLDHLMEYAKQLQLSSFELKKIFLSVDKDGRTVWHLAAISGSIQKMRKIWDLAKEISLNQEELKQILLANRDQEICQRVAKMGCADVLLQIWTWAKELEFNNEELKELVFTLDINRPNVWLLALTEGHLSVLELLWDMAQEINIQTIDFQQMLFHSRVLEGNGWFLATVRKPILLIEKLWTYIKAMRINISDLQEIILKKTLWKTSSLQLVAENGDVKMLCKLLELLEEVFTLKQLSDILITRINPTKTLWHYASVKQRTKILNIILEWGSKKLSGELLHDFWKAKAKYEKFILLVSSWKDLPLESILKWSKENLSLEDFKKTILRKHLLGKCAWESTWKCEKRSDIIQILRWCKQNLTALELNQVMRTEDGSAQTLFRLMVEKGWLEIFIDLWDWDVDVEARTAFKYFFISYYFTKDVGTILHCAMRKRDEKTLTNFLSYYFTKDVGTILHCAMRKRDEKTLTNFWKWGQQMRLSKQDYRSLVLTNDPQGDTFGHIAVWVSDKGSIDILVGVLNYAKTVLDTQDLKEFLKKKNFNNQNVLHLIACSKRPSQIIQLLAWCIVNLTGDEFQELMLDRCQQEATTLHVLATNDVKTWFNVIEWLEISVEWNIFTVLFLAVDCRQQNSMKVAKVKIAKGKIEGTIDEELYDKSASLPTWDGLVRLFSSSAINLVLRSDCDLFFSTSPIHLVTGNRY